MWTLKSRKPRHTVEIEHLLHTFIQMVTSKANEEATKMPAMHNFQSPVGAWNSAKVWQNDDRYKAFFSWTLIFFQSPFSFSRKACNVPDNLLYWNRTLQSCERNWPWSPVYLHGNGLVASGSANCHDRRGNRSSHSCELILDFIFKSNGWKFWFCVTYPTTSRVPIRSV